MVRVSLVGNPQANAGVAQQQFGAGFTGIRHAPRISRQPPGGKRNKVSNQRFLRSFRFAWRRQYATGLRPR